MDNHQPAIQFQSVWNRNESDRSAFANFWQAFQEDALSIRKENSLDGISIFFAITSDAAFLSRFGAAKKPRVHPGPPSGTREQIAIHAISLPAFMLQQAIIEAARTHLLKQAPPHLFEASKDAHGSLHSRSLEFLCTSLLDQVGILSKADIKGLYARIKVPYASGEHIESFVLCAEICFANWRRPVNPSPRVLKVLILRSAWRAQSTLRLVGSHSTKIFRRQQTRLWSACLPLSLTTLTLFTRSPQPGRSY
ncbi:MAG: hypothetical protein RLZZ419_313 [Pseudomonadota bacterium]